jgi:hypothetical protein
MREFTPPNFPIYMFDKEGGYKIATIGEVSPLYPASSLSCVCVCLLTGLFSFCRIRLGRMIYLDYANLGKFGERIDRLMMHGCINRMEMIHDDHRIHILCVSVSGLGTKMRK